MEFGEIKEIMEIRELNDYLLLSSLIRSVVALDPIDRVTIRRDRVTIPFDLVTSSVICNIPTTILFINFMLSCDMVFVRQINE